MRNLHNRTRSKSDVTHHVEKLSALLYATKPSGVGITREPALILKICSNLRKDVLIGVRNCSSPILPSVSAFSKLLFPRRLWKAILMRFPVEKLCGLKSNMKLSSIQCLKHYSKCRHFIFKCPISREPEFLILYLAQLSGRLGQLRRPKNSFIISWVLAFRWDSTSHFDRSGQTMTVRYVYYYCKVVARWMPMK